MLYSTGMHRAALLTFRHARNAVPQAYTLRNIANVKVLIKYAPYILLVTTKEEIQHAALILSVDQKQTRHISTLPYDFEVESNAALCSFDAIDQLILRKIEDAG